MTLAPGIKLGPYEILSPLGAGGMGEVYKAKDSRLDRFVAIKVLPEHLTKSPDALARFEREAKAVATLNHPNILAIHDLGQQDGVQYAVMELLEGESLRARLHQGPLQPRKVTDFAAQIAQGLAAAHDKGVVHRDLKPENLWLSKDGRVKILDFGLAKHVLPAGHGSQSYLATEAVSPGQIHHTEDGLILGTMGYMSPEQVRGEAVDARSDLFSFGAVLFEMLTGLRAFERPSASDTLAAILRDDPPEPPGTGRPIPPGLRRILDHCLEKAPEHRFQEAHDLAFALESAAGSSTDSQAAFTVPFAPQHRRTTFQWAALGVLALLAAVLGGYTLRGRLEPAASASSVAVRIVTHSGRDTSPAASPDGRTIAFTSQRDGRPRIWLKQVRGGGEVALTTGPDDFPRFSKDGASLLFIRTEGAETSLYRMSMLGTGLYKVVGNATHGDWSPDGNRIAFIRTTTLENHYSSSLRIIDAGGGAEKELANFPKELLVAPKWSPDGRALAATSGQILGGLSPKVYRINASDGAIRAFPAGARFGAISHLAWVSSEEVIYLLAESVAGSGAGTSPSRAYRQNLRTGKAWPLFWSPATSTGLDVLPDGKVVFDGTSGRQNLRDYPLNRKGTPRWLTRGSINDRQPVFSRDGEWVVFSSNRSGNLDLWAVSTKTGVLKSLTDDSAEDWDPGFSPDGKRVLWSSNRSGVFEIWMANVDGSQARQVTRDGVDAENPTQTPDGRWIVYTSGDPKAPGIWKIHPDGTGGTRLLAGSTHGLPEVSPDGRYVLVQTTEAGITTVVHAVRLEDGAETAFQAKVENLGNGIFTLGRGRWAAGGRQVIFTGQNAQGLNGVYLQDFDPGRDTASTRKPLAGFDPDWITESLGLSPDGTRLVLSESERMFSLMVAEGVPGLQKGRK
jgi:Tol biopolymer transport system component/serine/threonine protein kinase